MAWVGRWSPSSWPRAIARVRLRFLSALRLCIPATTLGDVYSLLLHPATSSHSYLSAEERQAMGISEGLLRLSVGIEDAGDIMADLDQALRASGG